ncbi:MAG: O-antigen ligase family protein [Simkaniaceae bacterium]|nr:O-antigen ligase family protein [Candidatus Sacchlamyda saccharinae]
MADIALFSLRGKAVFSLKAGLHRLILHAFALFLVLGQFLRLIPLPFVPSNISIAEILLYGLTLPLFFSRLRKSMWALLAICLSTLYGALLNGLDVASAFYAGKLCAMIATGVVIGDILAKNMTQEEMIDYFLRIFLVIFLLGLGIFVVFPKAHQFFALLDQYGVHFIGDPHQRRFISTFFDPNYYAAIACIPLIMTWVRGKKFLFWCFLASILLTFSRSGIATCLVLLLFQVRKLPVLIFLLLCASCFYFEELMVFFERILQLGSDPSALARLETFQTGLQFFWQHPFFGVGYHYLSPLFFLEFGRLSPDSSLLITLIDFGLIPTLFFFAAGLYWTIQQFHKKRGPLFYWLFFYAVICLVFTSLFNNLLYFQYWLIPMIALLGATHENSTRA